MLKALIRNLGPGILFASMSIGTSHLVLSTKAGAQYGWIMVIPIILANVFKYPFFEFGVRYTATTKKSLIEGYLLLGKKYLWLYTLITLVSVVTILAALYAVTSGLLINLLDLKMGVNLVALLLFAFISALLIIGRYRFLELSLKMVVAVLFLALVITTIMVLIKGKVPTAANFEAPAIINEGGILFLIGLMGWMPTAVEASGWVSVWSQEKFKSMVQKPNLREALQEFDFGYLITGLLAIFFLIIGWFTLYGTGTELSGNSVQFADQVVTLFTAHIGDWAYSIIAIAAFATMFSTCMTAHDAVTRVSLEILGHLKNNLSRFKTKKVFAISILLAALLNWMVLLAFGGHMGTLVALATFVSFVFAPIVGWMNLKTVTSEAIPKNARPNKGLRFLTYLGMVFLSFFSLYYFWMVLF